MKKVISSILSLSLILGSVNTSFAAETPQMEANFTIKTNFPTQPTTKTPELTKKEKEALKLEEELKEKLKDSYSDIIEQNPCMKTAFKEVIELFRENNYHKITNKINQLKDEKESLLDYKKTILEKSDSKYESLDKQLKNINNRLQAIEYTENCLTKFKKREDGYGKKVLIAILSFYLVIAACISSSCHKIKTLL